jgi:hypothetical protein
VIQLTGLYTNPHACGSHPGVGEVESKHANKTVQHEYYGHISNIILVASFLLGCFQMSWTITDTNRAYTISRGITSGQIDYHEGMKMIANYITRNGKLFYYLKVIIADTVLLISTGVQMYWIDMWMNNYFWEFYAKMSFFPNDGVLFPYTVHCRYKTLLLTTKKAYH